MLGQVVQRMVCTRAVALVLIPLICLSCGEPPPPPISEPGSRGTRVEEDPIRVWHEVREAIPEVLDCWTEYAFQVTAVGALPCDSLPSGGWDDLYAQAQSQGDARIAQLECPDECPHRNAWVFRQRAACNDSGYPFVELSYIVRCVPEDAELISGLQNKNPGEITGPFDEYFDGPPPEPTESIKIIAFTGLSWPSVPQCPTLFRFSVSYDDWVEDCWAVDYQPYIEKAEADAATIWAQLSCPCEKQPFEEQFVEWGCAPNLPRRGQVFVNAQYYFECLSGE